MKTPQTKVINFRVTEEQYVKIRVNAEENGLNVGPYLRALGLHGFKLFVTAEMKESPIAIAAGVEFTPKSQNAKSG